MGELENFGQIMAIAKPTRPPWYQSKAIEYLALGIAAFLVCCGMGTCFRIAGKDGPTHEFIHVETKEPK